MSGAPHSYTHRLNAFNPVKVWTVEPGGIGWADQDEDGESGFIPIEKIKSVRLRYEPSRAETRRVGLHIYTPYDHHITNINYKGAFNFEHRPDAFREFVLAFHGMFPAGTETVFHSGSTKGAYIGNILISVLVLAFLLFLAPILSITGIPSAASIFRIVMILIFLPILANVILKNRPQTYQADAPPLDMLT